MALKIGRQAAYFLAFCCIGNACLGHAGASESLPAGGDTARIMRAKPARTPEMPRNTALGRGADTLALTPLAAYRSFTYSPVEIPSEFVGAWQLRIEGPAFKLKTSYNIELKITDGRSGSPEALISYFAGNENRPSTICRTQLNFVSAEGQNWVFNESLNYRAGKDACPVWDQISIMARGENLWLQWRDAGRRKVTIKMEGGARRSTGGMECRSVGGSGQSGGQVFCRTPDGDWVPRIL